MVKLLILANFHEIDLLTSLMTFDPDEKKIHMYTGKMHCSSVNQKILLCLGLEIKILEVFFGIFDPVTPNDLWLTFDLISR